MMQKNSSISTLEIFTKTLDSKVNDINLSKVKSNFYDEINIMR